LEEKEVIMQLNPIKTSQLIKSSYVNYLKTLFPINDLEIEREFHKMLEDEAKLFKGPYLESTPPYVTGKSIKELQDENLLSPLFDTLNSDYLPSPLYLHQEKAIRKIVNGRNLIVATGTGSGKTEAFLIPIFNHLLTEKDKGTLCPGVRALLLYPMNALANDQVKRLRQLLKNCPDITFGRYIGETETDKNRARDDYKKTYVNDPLPNELLSRAEMWETPPHILLTNYAMLEYLLLRPADNVFFDGQHSRHWRFIVMDEVHTYDGAKGIETAMLLRRLKDRILKGNDNKIQCIGTSATVGGGEKDFDKVAHFGSQLFSETFECDKDDESRQDVVHAERLTLTTAETQKWLPAPEFYNELNEYIEGADEPDLSTILEIAKTFNVPKGILLSVSKSNISHLTDQKEKYKIWIYILLKDDERLHALHKLLNEPQSLKDISDSLNISEEHLVSFVNLAVRAKSGENDAPLLPARYHFFVKALEGGFVSFSPDKKLLLNPETKRIEDGEKYPVFEMATCKQCGSIYLVGEEKDNKLLQAKGITEDNIEKAAFYHVRSDITLPDEDEDIAEEIEEEILEEEYTLCAGCGALARKNMYDQDICACTPSKKRLMKLFKASDSGGTIKRCPSCGTRGNVVYRFLTGQDAPASVLSTALYQEIPEREIEMQPKSQEDSGWEDTEIKKSRKLLIFSDSRQDAAYFAPYLGDITYQPILWRRLIVEILNKKADEIIRDNWTIKDFVEPLRKRAFEANLFNKVSVREQKIQSWQWLIKEFTSLERRISLEGVGLIKFKLIKPQNLRNNNPIFKFLSQSPWRMNEDEAWALCELLIDSFRLQSAIEFPEDISPEDELFSPRNREYFFRFRGSSPKKHIYSWQSTSKGKKNKRVDFLLKLLKSFTGIEDINKCNEALQKIWDGLTNQNSPLRNYLGAKPVLNEGYVYQLKLDAYRLVPNYKNHITWFRCSRCGNLTNINIRNVCPTYQCTGELKPCIPEQELINNHYRKLYHDLKLIPMICKEHTAQLSGKRASQLQSDFMQGKVNIISCSTTFELGVDVGSLEAVMMRNMPPSPANYIQRAGRAGRRTDSAAFSLTYCQRRPHDLSFFAEPLKIIKGEIKPPIFEVKNEKIIRRHMHSAVFSSFWRDNRELFGKVKDFFFDINEKEIKSLDEFKKEHPIFSFLQKRPKEIELALRNIVPEELHSALNLETWGWLKELIDDKDGSLIKAADMVYPKTDLEIDKKSKPPSG
jgi:Zn-finger nucleic acid-binding protein